MVNGYNPILKDIVGILNPQYFKIQRFNFWKLYSQIKGLKEVNPEWFNKDGYTYPYMQDTDLETGQSKVSAVTTSLHSHLQNDIHSRFSRFFNLYENQLLEFDREFKKDNFRNLMISSLKSIHNELKIIDAEKEYFNTIVDCFELEFKRYFPKKAIDQSNIRKDGFIKYLKIENENGLISFKMFFDDLKDHGLIANNTDYKQFKSLFKGKIPEKKIRWEGSKAQLVTLIKHLISEESFIQSENHWVVVERSFAVFKNGLKEFKLQKLHTATGLTNEKKIQEIVDMVDRL